MPQRALQQLLLSSAKQRYQGTSDQNRESTRRCTEKNRCNDRKQNYFIRWVPITVKILSLSSFYTRWMPCIFAVKKNCAELYKSGERINGVYTIDSDDLGAFDVFWDQTTAGGGWTVFRKRLDGSVDFSTRGWPATTNVALVTWMVSFGWDWTKLTAWQRQRTGCEWILKIHKERLIMLSTTFLLFQVKEAIISSVLENIPVGVYATIICLHRFRSVF